MSAQVEAAIEQDPNNREWTKLRADLLEVIQLTSELAQVTPVRSRLAQAAPRRDADHACTLRVHRSRRRRRRR